ncbi:SKU5 similar 5 [Prunus dulcis]|uniref:SKU5 similar 5 n=1 Tax=Prunus dulcis TaxID=3755 RepID=A0A4Y1R728_PRUDU|nr:SKU5 similar 5 [Prunus dulcis]
MRNGVQQRRNSWQDGVFGTNCPIPPGQNFTYALQVKDQIGSYFYFPSLGFHKAAGGFGGIKIASRSVIQYLSLLLLETSPYWQEIGSVKNHTLFTARSKNLITLALLKIYNRCQFRSRRHDLKAILDSGNNLPSPDGLLINGRGSNGFTFTVDQGKTYRLRISNVGLTASINFRIQGHKMLLVEVEGTHSLQNTYSSLDIHLGQSYSVLVTADQQHKITTLLSLRVSLHSAQHNVHSSLQRNLTASGPRPNPQGSYHYGLINTTRTIRLTSSAPIIDGKQRYAVNSVSFIQPDTPLKLADYFKISGVFSIGSIQDNPLEADGWWTVGTCKQIKIQFEGHDFSLHRSGISNSWTAIYMPLDNVGMWNVRSENWARQYLGQQFYLRVYSPANSWRDEYPIPRNALLCGRALGRRTRPL